MVIILRSILVISYLFFIYCLYGQKYPAINVTIEDGLPSNTVYDLYQDSKGFLWVGTENGLARYDGANFKTFHSEGLKSSAIGNITEDKYGDLWMINFYGQVLCLREDTIRPLKPWEDIRKTDFPRIAVRSDTVYIAMLKQGLYQYVISTREFVQLRTYEKDDSKYIKVGDSNEIWLIRSKFIQRLVPGNHFKYNIGDKRIPWLTPGIAKYGEGYILTDRFKNILFYLQDGKLQDLASNEYTLKTLPSVRGIEAMNHNALGFMGLDGLLILNEDHQFLNVFQGLNVGALESIDEDGIIIGTLDRGLFFAPSLETLQFPPASNTGYFRIAHDQNNQRLIVGDLAGNLHFYDYQGDLIHVIRSPERTEVQSLFIDQEEEVLLAHTKSLEFFDLKSFRKIKEVIVGPTKEIVKFQGQYHLATSFGLKSLNSEAEALTRVKGRMKSVSPFDQDQLLFTGQNGTFIFNWKDETMHSFSHYFEKDVEGINKLKRWDDYFLFGTHNRGIWVFKKDKFITNLNTENGLLSNRVNAIAITDSIFAVATNKGVSLVSWTDFEVTNIDRSKGLQSNEVTDLVFANNKLWVTNLTGLQSFKLPVSKNTEKPQIYIDGLSVDNAHQIVPKDKILLPHDFNELVINMVVSNNIKGLGKTKIFYRIKELNEDKWNSTTLRQSKATYLSLPPDDYSFEAYAVNEDFMQSDILRFQIVVKTPFWQSVWFQMLCVLLGLLIVGSVIFWYLKRVNKVRQEELVRKNRAQELRIAQLTSIRAQMNPHFIFNTMSLIKGLVVKGEPKEASHAIQDFSQLMRSVLDLSSVEIVPLSAEIQILEKYLSIERKRFEDKLSYSIQVSEEVIPEMIKIPSLLTQPFVENAIKHGLLHRVGEKKLWVRFDICDDHCLEIQIEDNGIGRKAAASLRKDSNRHSFAIEAYKKRIELLNESSLSKISLEILDKESVQGRPDGTLVIVKIPLIQ